MSISRVVTAGLASLALLAGGCAHEQLPWPPAASDVRRINEAAEANQWLRVDYVEPIASLQGVHAGKVIGIESLDENHVAFRTAAGETRLVPSEIVRGVGVKEPARGAAIGAGAGLGVGALMIGSLFVLAVALAGPDDPTAPQPSCDGGCIAKTMVPLLVIPTIVGAVAGYFVGARRTFQFQRAR